MSKLTAKQQAFVDGKLAGLPTKQAGLMAGYAPTAILVATSKLMAHPGIKAAIAAGKRKAGKISTPEADKDESSVMLPHYESSLALMQHSYNNPRLPTGVRFEAAKQALPYEHGRVGEKGKKETKVDTAKEVAKGRYAPKAPPKLASVTNIR